MKNRMLMFLVVCVLAFSSKTFAVEDYFIWPGDILEISVWKEPDLTRELLVRPDGGISLPLAGDLLVRDKTVIEFNKPCLSV